MTLNELTEQLATVRAYRGTELYAAMIDLLDVLLRSYTEDLFSLTAETLAKKQGAALQCQLLRNALRAESIQDSVRV